MSSVFGKYSASLGFFAVGALSEVYTGTTVVTSYKNGVKDTKTKSYNYRGGTGVN